MLTSKQRAYLRGLANGIEAIVHVGKNGVVPMLVQQVDDALTARELVKGMVQQNIVLSAREAAEELAQATNSEVVQVIGRRFVLYRINRKEPKIKLDD